MSVIVKRLKSTCMEVYVKGAPEVMPDICDPSSCKRDNVFIVVVADYDSLQSPTIMMICFLITLEMGSVSLLLLANPLRV